MCHTTGMNERERGSLKNAHLHLLEVIDLDESNVIHHLRQDDVISSGEYDEVMSQPDRRRKVVKLLYLLKKRGSDKKPYDNFKKALNDDYPDVVSLLESTYDNVKIKCEPSVELCCHCYVLQNVIASDLSHDLYGSGVISDDEYMHLNESGTYNKDNVLRLIKALLKYPDIFEASRHLMGALGRKYSHVKEYINGKNLSDLCKCTCGFAQNRDSTQQNDLPDMITELVDRLSAAKVGKQSKGARKDMPKRLRHGKLYKARDYIKRKAQRSCEGTWPIQAGEVFDGERRPPLPLHKCEVVSVYKLPDATMTKHIGYFDAGPEELMFTCKELWDELFKLRERGDWAQHAERTAQAMSEYSNNPDIQVLLYRSKMCVASFYHRDTETAEKMHEKAKSLIPKTRMSAWHSARLFSLEVAYLIEQKRFQEAEQRIKEAKIAMAGLAPCMSTGAVFFFEALYLWGLLKCRRKSVVAAQLSRRIRECFCTAIYHYEQEKVFDINSFLNQVYLFMALCALHVDITSKSFAARYADFGPPTIDDLACAEEALKRFRENGWGDRTDWSEMLYHIGRAELHRYVEGEGNIQTALSCYKDALQLAVTADFQVHEEFIKITIEKLNQNEVFKTDVSTKRVDSYLSGEEQDLEESQSDGVT